jgi:NitT/TauT family transport system substrate-binding protein
LAVGTRLAREAGRMVLAMLLLTALLASCAPGIVPPLPRPDDDALPVSALPRTVRVTTPGISLSFLPAKVAVDLGLYEEEGIQLELMPVSSGDAAVAAVLSGEADYTTLLATAMAAISRGAPLRVVHYQSVRPMHVLVGRPEIAAVSDLDGRRLGIRRLDDLTASEAYWLIERYGLTDVAVLQLGGEAERLAALTAQRVDATLLPLPWDLQAERVGMRRLLDLSDVLELAHGGYATILSKLHARPDEVRRVIRATNRGIAVVRDPASRDAVAEIVAQWAELSFADAQQVVDAVRDAFTPTGLPTEAQVAGLLDLLKSTGVVPSSATVEEMVDLSLAEAVAREMGLETLVVQAGTAAVGTPPYRRPASP